MRRPIWLLLGLLLIIPLVLAACGDDDDMAGMDHGSTTTGTVTATEATGGASSPTAGMGAMTTPTHDMGAMGSPTGEMDMDMDMDHDADGTPGTSDDMDLMFIDGMIPHHQSAIDMAEIALEEAEREEIRTLAQEIITAQEAEIEQLTAWRDEWFPGAPAVDMSGMEDMAGMSMSEADMQALRDADPFDQAFMEQMIPHHESAVTMAEEVLTTTERPEIQRLAEEIIVAQEAEIEQMREWLTEWFGT